LRKVVVRNVINFDAERVPDDLGGTVAASRQSRRGGHRSGFALISISIVASTDGGSNEQLFGVIEQTISCNLAESFCILDGLSLRECLFVFFPPYANQPVTNLLQLSEL
jgi:hypothetical protein